MENREVREWRLAASPKRSGRVPATAVSSAVARRGRWAGALLLVSLVLAGLFAIDLACNALTTADIIELTDGTFSGAGNRIVDYQGEAIIITSVDETAYERLGAEGVRTLDLMTASHALSQLSYGPLLTDNDRRAPHKRQAENRAVTYLPQVRFSPKGHRGAEVRARSMHMNLLMHTDLDWAHSDALDSPSGIECPQGRRCASCWGFSFSMPREW